LLAVCPLYTLLLYADSIAAGDSAQCISNDSAFRFANVKALFYEHYISVDPRLAKPELFSLTRNFRSHQGILSLASFVMGLLWKGDDKRYLVLSSKLILAQAFPVWLINYHLKLANTLDLDPQCSVCLSKIDSGMTGLQQLTWKWQLDPASPNY